MRGEHPPLPPGLQFGQSASGGTSREISIAK